MLSSVNAGEFLKIVSTLGRLFKLSHTVLNELKQRDQL